MKIDPEDMLTIKDVMKMFGVGQMTIWKWRNIHEMPDILIPGNNRNNVRFDKPSILKWARKNGKPVVEDVPTIKEKLAAGSPTKNPRKALHT